MLPRIRKPATIYVAALLYLQNCWIKKVRVWSLLRAHCHSAARVTTMIQQLEETRELECPPRGRRGIGLLWGLEACFQMDWAGPTTRRTQHILACLSLRLKRREQLNTPFCMSDLGLLKQSEIRAGTGKSIPDSGSLFRRRRSCQGLVFSSSGCVETKYGKR